MTGTMLKRLVGVVCVKDGWAVQSIGYRHYRPIGRPETVVENLDRWGMDEILVLSIDRSTKDAGPDFELLERISRRAISTPLCFGGGIRNVDDTIRIVRGGADRVAIETLFGDDPAACERIADAIGRQAVIRALPVNPANGSAGIEQYDYHRRTSAPLAADSLEATRVSFSELLLIDWQAEGHRNGFRDTLLDDLPADLQVICFGGISEPEQVARLVERPDVSAVAVGNFLNYTELAPHALVPRDTGAMRAAATR